MISTIHSEGTWAVHSLLDLLNRLVQQAPTRTVVVTGSRALSQWLVDHWASEHAFLPMVCTIEELGHVLDPGTSPLSDMQQLDWQQRTVTLLSTSYPVQATSLQLPTMWEHAVTWLGMDPSPVSGWLPGLEGLPWDVFRRQAFRALDDAGYVPSVRVWGRWRDTGMGAFTQWAKGKTVVYLPSPIETLGEALMAAVWEGCDAGVVIEQVVPGSRPMALFGGGASVVPWSRPLPSVGWFTCESVHAQAVQLATWIEEWSQQGPLSEIGVVCPASHCRDMAASLGRLGVPVRFRNHRPLIASPLAMQVVAQLGASYDDSPMAFLRSFADWGKDMTESDDRLLVKRALVRIVTESSLGGSDWARWAQRVIQKATIPTLADPGGVWLVDPVGAVQLPVSRMVITHATSSCYPVLGHPLSRPRLWMGSEGIQSVVTHLLYQARQSIRVLTPLEIDGVPQTPSVVMAQVMTAHATRTHHEATITDEMARAVGWRVAARDVTDCLAPVREAPAVDGGERGVSDAPSIRLSPSTFQDYQTCPHMYWMMDGLGVDPSRGDGLALSPSEEGTLVHQVMEWAGGYLMTERGDVGGMLAMITEKATAQWHRHPYKEWWAFCRWMGDVGRRGVLAEALMHLYEWVQGITLLAVEYRPPRRVLGDGTLVSGVIDLVGRDRQTGSLVLVDYKTGTMPTIKEVSGLRSLPLSVYAWLLQADPQMGGQDAEGQGMVSAMAWRIHPSEFKTQWIMATTTVKRALVPPRCRPFEPTPAHFQALEARMEVIAHGIRSGRFHPHDLSVMPKNCERCMVRWGCRFRGKGEPETSGGDEGAVGSDH